MDGRSLEERVERRSHWVPVMQTLRTRSSVLLQCLSLMVSIALSGCNHRCDPGIYVRCTCADGSDGLQACGSDGTPQGECAACAGSGGGAGGGSASGGGGSDNETPTLIADWVQKLQTGKNEINMSSSSAGHAQLYWYDSGEAQWQVSAEDDGAGNARLTLTCTSSDCASATDIVMNCTYNLIALKCVGVSGGLMNNYANYPLNLTKQ